MKKSLLAAAIVIGLIAPMNNSQLRIRPQTMLKVMAIGIPATISLTGLAVFGYQKVQLWLSGGAWCVRYQPDGKEVVLYGGDCKK